MTLGARSDQEFLCFGPFNASTFSTNGMSLFIADQAYRLAGPLLVCWTVPATQGSLVFRKTTGTNTPLSGTAICNSPSLLGAANTVNSLTLNLTEASLKFAPGDRLSMFPTLTPTNLEGLIVMVRMLPRSNVLYHLERPESLVA